MVRGKEARLMPIGALLKDTNPMSKPMPMNSVVFGVHNSKTNKEGKHQDWRAITHHRNLLKDPMLHLSILAVERTCVHRGAPMSETMAELFDWCASMLIDADVDKCRPGPHDVY